MLLIYEGILTVTLNSQGRDSEVIGQPVNRLKVTPKTLTHIKPTIRASYSTRRYSNVAYYTAVDKSTRPIICFNLPQLLFP